MFPSKPDHNWEFTELRYIPHCFWQHLYIRAREFSTKTGLLALQMRNSPLMGNFQIAIWEKRVWADMIYPYLSVKVTPLLMGEVYGRKLTDRYNPISKFGCSPIGFWCHQEVLCLRKEQDNRAKARHDRAELFIPFKFSPRWCVLGKELLWKAVSFWG